MCVFTMYVRDLMPFLCDSTVRTNISLLVLLYLFSLHIFWWLERSCEILAIIQYPIALKCGFQSFKMNFK